MVFLLQPSMCGGRAIREAAVFGGIIEKGRAGLMNGECDSLYMLGPGSGTIRRYGPVGVGVALRVWAIRPSSLLPGS